MIKIKILILKRQDEALLKRFGGNENELEQINKVEELNEKDLVPVDYKPSINVFKDKCTICLEDFKDKEKVIVLSCKHIFHYECIKNNLINKHFKCPNCNIELKKDDVVTYKNISQYIYVFIIYIS